MKRLCKPTVLFLAALASGVAFLPVSAQSNSDWYRRQQQQQQQQQQMRQQQMRQQQQQQMREQMQQQQRQQMQQQLRQQQTQQRRQMSESSIRAGSQRRVGRAAAGVEASIISKRSDRVLYSNGVAKLTRSPTPGEMRRGFTGKVTQDGRALVKINGRVLAVPAARIGVKVNRSPSMGRPQASQWSASKRAAISATVQKLASTNLKNRVRTGGGGRRPPGGGGGDDNNKDGKLLWTSWEQYPKVYVKGEPYAQIGTRLYAKHAVERMQPSGLGYPAGASAQSLGKTGGAGKGRSIAPAYVEEVIRTGNRSYKSTKGVKRTYHSAGTTTVVTEDNGKIVVTILTQ